MGTLSGKIASSGLTPTYVNSAANVSAGKLYQCDTSSAAFTVTLPTGTTGSVLRFVDDQGTWGTNALTISPAASQTIQGISGSGSLVCNLSGAYVEFTWDATNSWWVVQTTGFQYGPAATSTARGIVYAQKQYVVGTTYTNGTPNVTCGQAGWAVLRGALIPYQTYDGAWRLRFGINGTFTSASITAASATISGTTFKTGYTQGCAGFFGGATTAPRIYIPGGAGTINFDTPSALSVSGLSMSGDVELDSKPTWAD